VSIILSISGSVYLGGQGRRTRLSFCAGEGKWQGLVPPRDKMAHLPDLKAFRDSIKVIGDPLSKMVIRGRGTLLMFYIDMDKIRKGI